MINQQQQQQQWKMLTTSLMTSLRRMTDISSWYCEYWHACVTDNMQDYKQVHWLSGCLSVWWFVCVRACTFKALARLCSQKGLNANNAWWYYNIWDCTPLQAELGTGPGLFPPTRWSGWPPGIFTDTETSVSSLLMRRAEEKTYRKGIIWYFEQ